MNGQRQRQRGPDGKPRVGEQGQEDQVGHVEVDLPVHQRAQDGHVDRHEGQDETGGHASIEAVPDEGQRQEPGEGGDREHVPDPQGRPHSSPAERHEELAGGGQQRRVDVALVERPPLAEVEGRPHVVAGVGVLAALAQHVRVQEKRQEGAGRDEAEAGPEGGIAEEREHETAGEPDEPDRGVGQLEARDRAHLDESGEHLGALRDEQGPVHDDERRRGRRPQAERQEQEAIEPVSVRLVHVLPAPRAVRGQPGRSVGLARPLGLREYTAPETPLDAPWGVAQSAP